MSLATSESYLCLSLSHHSLNLVAGKVSLRCTGVQQQDGPPLSRNPKKQAPSEKFHRKELKSKLHRGWHPGQRTQAPPTKRVIISEEEREQQVQKGRNSLHLDEPILEQGETKVYVDDRRMPSQQREYLFDVEDDEEFFSDDDENDEDDDDQSEENVFDMKNEDDRFVAAKMEQREDSEDSSATDLDCKHFSRYSNFRSTYFLLCCKVSRHRLLCIQIQ